MICLRKYTLVASMGGRYAWQSCSRKLYSSFLDFILALSWFMLTGYKFMPTYMLDSYEIIID
jgi:hypothetical protein